MRQKNIECWLLYQVCETSGVDIKVISSESMPLTIPDVQLESLCYILYKKGEYYHLEGLMDQLEQNQINMEQILLKKRLIQKYQKKCHPG